MDAGERTDPYGVDRWGDGYVLEMENGDLGLLNPLQPDAAPVSLPSVVASLEERGIQTPVMIRVASYLKHSIHSLNTCFTDAMETYGYTGTYRGVFPIKVNQQAQVIKRITDYGGPYHFGLEAGSKPELVIALSQQLSSQALIVCNGVKDREFIEIACAPAIWASTRLSCWKA